MTTFYFYKNQGCAPYAERELKPGGIMKSKMLIIMFVTMVVLTGTSYGADDQASLGTQAVPQSLGGQAGEAARELKTTAAGSLSTGAIKVSESSGKVEAGVRETFKTLQQQWDVLAKQLQEKTQQIQKQIEQQLQDFNKAFHTPQQ